MYSFAIYLYALCVHLAACFNKKARLMISGHRQTWRRLKTLDAAGGYYWFHAASLGEFEQGRPLMERLRREHPEAKILLTFFSPSGYEVRKDYSVADVVCYLPFDTPHNARRFLRLVKPRAAFFIKYEFWRNYIDRLHRRDIPAYSVSSIFRDNQIFFRSYGRNYARCLRRLTHLYVQNEASQRLLATLGVTAVTVVGDTRFDRVIDIRRAARPLPLVQQFADGGGDVLVAGSSWPVDEAFLIDYFNAHPGVKLVLAPHVVTDDHIAAIQAQLQRPAVCYSQATPDNIAAADCLIIDGYGLLSSIYRYATLAYVGGGFGVSIHNVPEAAVYGVPVIIGPNNHKFREARDLITAGGCFEITAGEDFAAVADRLLADRDALAAAGRAAGAYITNNAGAADTIYADIFGR